jgi:hypothetical protein
VIFLIGGAAVLLVVLVIVGVKHVLYLRRVALEVRTLLSAPSQKGYLVTWSELPPIVDRYRRLAGGSRSPVRTLRLRHRGTFCTSPTATQRPIRGEQWFTADPPGFVWSARVRIAPGIWIRARDMIVAGKGGMRVLIEDTVTVADSTGPRFDQGDALRLLAEMVWYPTSLFDPRTVVWSSVDASHASATLHLEGCSVTGLFEFGADGLPVAMTAERLDDKGELRPWGGVYRDWRTVDGMQVPFEAEVAWGSPRFVYAHWLVDEMAYDSKPTPPSRWSAWALALELVLGVGALGGGGALMLGPEGEIIPLPVAALAGSPFANYFVPGLILFVMLGVAPIAAAILTLGRSRLAPWMALGTGGALVVWILVEIWIVGYSSRPPLQILYLALGLVIASVAVAWIRESAGRVSRAAAA